MESYVMRMGDTYIYIMRMRMVEGIGNDATLACLFLMAYIVSFLHPAIFVCPFFLINYKYHNYQTTKSIFSEEIDVHPN